MKTEMALLLMNDGNPVLPLAKAADLMGLGERSAENQIYAKRFAVPAFKLGAKWSVHVSDLARYIDSQRAAAVNELSTG